LLSGHAQTLRGIDEDHLFIGVTPKWLTITYIPIVVTLVNHNQTETAVDEYKLAVVIDGKEHKTENVPPERIRLTRPAFDSFGLPLNSEGVKSRYTDLFKHRHEPLKRGIPQQGWLLFVVKDFLIQPNTDCKLRLTIKDAFGGLHPLPEVRPKTRKSGDVNIPIEIDISDTRPITSSQQPDNFKFRVIELIIEGGDFIGRMRHFY
jgi:hypothetical protein